MDRIPARSGDSPRKDGAGSGTDRYRERTGRGETRRGQLSHLQGLREKISLFHAVSIFFQGEGVASAETVQSVQRNQKKEPIHPEY